MKKLGNKGFAISSIVYSILVLFVILLMATLALLTGRKVILDKSKQEIMNEIDTMEEDVYGVDNYTKNGLVVHYDGIENTRSGTHNSSATKWENLASSTGEYDGVLSGFSASAWTNGNGLTFDGVDDFVNVGSFNVLSPGITLEVVVKYTDNKVTCSLVGNLNEGGYALEHQYDPYLEYANEAFYGNHTLSYFNPSIGNDGAYQSLASPNESKQDYMYSVSVVIDNSSRKLFIYENGQEYSTTVSSLNLTAPIDGELLALGKPTKNTSITSREDLVKYLNGTIYSVRVYNKALTSLEVYKNYSIDRKRFDF